MKKRFTKSISHQTQLINAADTALYQAKNLGRNQIVIHSSTNLPTTL